MCRSRWGEICDVRSHEAAWAGSLAVLVSDMVTNSYEESAPVIYLGERISAVWWSSISCATLLCSSKRGAAAANQRGGNKNDEVGYM
jgi:hypothetical protein